MKTHPLRHARELLKTLMSLAPVCLLQGCMSFFTEPQLTTELTTMAANQQLQQWQLRGKIGIRQSNEAHSAYLNWRQCGDQFDIRLTGPFGQGAAHLVGNKNSATLMRGEQILIKASSPEQLLDHQLGWSIPVSRLLFWIRGIPDPDVPFFGISNPIGFKQSNWQLSYPKTLTADSYTLPAKAVAKQSALTVTLVLKQWDLTPRCESAI